MYQVHFTVVQYVNRQVRVDLERKTEPVARINPIKRVEPHHAELEEQANAYGILPELKLPGRKFDREV